MSVLLYNRAKQTVLLLRQPRIVAILSGDPCGETLEVCCGLIEDETALECALREVEQETGHRLRELTPVTEMYASPLGSLEVVQLFMGEYSEETRITPGGGIHNEGEDIEILEVDLKQAVKWIENRHIRDGRSIILLLHLCLQEKLHIGNLLIPQAK